MSNNEHVFDGLENEPPDSSPSGSYLDTDSGINREYVESIIQVVNEGIGEYEQHCRNEAIYIGSEVIQQGKFRVRDMLWAMAIIENEKLDRAHLGCNTKTEFFDKCRTKLEGLIGQIRFVIAQCSLAEPDPRFQPKRSLIGRTLEQNRKKLFKSNKIPHDKLFHLPSKKQIAAETVVQEMMLFLTKNEGGMSTDLESYEGCIDLLFEYDEMVKLAKARAEDIYQRNANFEEATNSD